MEPPLEYLGTDAPRRHRAAAALLGAALAMAALAAAALWWSDSVRQAANIELSATFREATDRAVSGERGVQGTLAYASPMIWSSSVPETVRDDLRALVEASAAEVGSDLAALEARAAGVTVLPWQAPQADARSALVSLVAAQRERFEQIAADARNIDRILADGPIPTGQVAAVLRSAGAE